MTSRALLILIIFTSFETRAQADLQPLLDRGPLVLVEPDASGKFGQATAIAYVAAPPEKVFQAAMEMGKFTEFMPKVTTADLIPTPNKPNEFDIRTVLDVPGPDTDYTVHFVRDDKKLEAKGTWAKGDLKGSKWFWKVEKAPDGNALLTHTITIKGFSAVLANLEDEQQTMTVGVNVSSALAAVKAIKRRAESKPPVKK